MTEPAKSEAVILCEGYYDRAFWAGWLTCFGCHIPGDNPDKSEGVKVFDPMGKSVKGGQYGYYSPSGKFIRVIPCKGKEKLLTEFRSRLGQYKLEPLLARLIINVDPDVDTSAPETEATGLRTQDILAQAQAVVPSATLNAEGSIEIDGGVTVVSLIRWEARDEPATRGLPSKQTLERLVCASIVAAYPERGECVHNWLATRHEPPPEGVKEFAWSYMAGWYAADHGCDEFYRHLWDDANIRSELEKRLRVSGAWQIVEILAG